MIFIRHPFNCALKYLDFESTTVNESVLRDAIVTRFGYGDFILFYNGRKVQHAESIPNNSTIQITFSLPGGKGGFGSMLRAIGAQIEKTTNREACRDLSGRRLRDINEEQRLKKWISKEAEREADKIRRRKARIERLKSKPAHKFFNFEYEKEISELPDRINDALSEGLQRAKLPTKRPAEEAGPSSKLPKKTWLSDEYASSSSDSDFEANTAGNESPSKKQKTDSGDSEVSDLSQPGPSSSRSDLELEENSNFNSDSGLSADIKEIPEQSKENTSNDSVEIKFQSVSTIDHSSRPENEELQYKSSIMESDELECNENVNEVVQSSPVTTASQSNTEAKDIEVIALASQSNTEAKDIEVIAPASQTNTEAAEIKETLSKDILDFSSIQDLEALGLDKLKSMLMSCGLKCGGTLSDRANRLWQIRGLQASEYPADLLVKSKRATKKV